MFDKTMSFSPHISYIDNVASKAIIILKPWILSNEVYIIVPYKPNLKDIWALYNQF